ncbi:MAG: hypothetical protein WCP55_16960 [Lentisphaerota bacterium]
MKHEHIWTASGTDIEERWTKIYGWVRPSEQAEYQAKYKYYQELPLRKLDDQAKVAYEAVLRKAKVVRIK